MLETALERARAEKSLRGISSCHAMGFPGTLRRSQDDASRGSGAAVVGASALPSGVAAEQQLFALYEVADFRGIRHGGDVYEATTETLAEMVSRVVEVEGPVHVEVLTERIRVAFGLGRAGRIVRERIDEAVRAALRRGTIEWIDDGTRAEDPHFLIACTAASPFPPRSTSTSEDRPRKIEHIWTGELQQGLLNVLGRSTVRRKDALVETARQFGYQRTGTKISGALGASLNSLVQKGAVRVQGENLVVPNAKPSR